MPKTYLTILNDDFYDLLIYDNGNAKFLGHYIAILDVNRTTLSYAPHLRSNLDEFYINNQSTVQFRVPEGVKNIKCISCYHNLIG